MRRVEVDEVLIGGLTPGRKGRHIGAKTLVEVAVEQLDRRFGRCRMEVIADAGSAPLRRFLIDHVDDGSTVISSQQHPDGGYPHVEHQPVRRLASRRIVVRINSCNHVVGCAVLPPCR
jgi:hypothetical protein